MSENMKNRAGGGDAGLSAEELEMERALQSLAPVDAGVNRDAMMFAAGKAAAKRYHLWPWQAGCLAMMLVCAGWMVYGPVRTVEREVIVHVPVAAPIQTVSALPVQIGPVLQAFGEGFLRLDEPRAAPDAMRQADYLSLRRAVLQHGLDALPMPKASTVEGTAPAPAKKDELFDALPRWQREQLMAGGQL